MCIGNPPTCTSRYTLLFQTIQLNPTHSHSTLNEFMGELNIPDNSFTRHPSPFFHRNQTIDQIDHVHTNQKKNCNLKIENKTYAGTCNNVRSLDTKLKYIRNVTVQRY